MILNFKVKHPLIKGKLLPVFIANFVLMEYSLGAIFGCPAHDQRDLDFANKYGLEVIPVVKPDNVEEEKFKISNTAFVESGKLINSEFLNGLSVEDAKNKIIKVLEEKNIGQSKVNYRLRDWGISRQRFWGCPIPVIYKEDGSMDVVDENELPVKLPEIKNFDASSSTLANISDWKETVCTKSGVSAVREMILSILSLNHQYYFRYCNQKAKTLLKKRY